jgi:SAM-dependent methyltransferase
VGRRREVTKYINPEMRGIEIGPWFNPLAPKRAGYNCLVLDFLDGESLRKRASADVNIPQEAITNIEEVDLLGSCTAIADLVAAKHPLGTFEYVISSHNFEHLPNPILFLHGCEKVLKRGGILSMAVPDRRACFDYFRPVSTLADWLEAYFEARTRPTAAQVFAQEAFSSKYRSGGRETANFSLDDDPHCIVPLETLREALSKWEEFRRDPDDNYRDTHCSVFTPASFELLLRDLRFLGLTQFEVLEISATHGVEFYVHLRNGEKLSADPLSTGAFYELRRKLMHRVNDEAAVNSIRAFELRRELRAAQPFSLTRTIADAAEWLPALLKARYWRVALSWRSRIWRIAWPLRRTALRVRNFAKRSLRPSAR